MGMRLDDGEEGGGGFVEVDAVVDGLGFWGDFQMKIE